MKFFIYLFIFTFFLDSVECIQTINLGSKYPIDLAISYLPESKGNVLFRLNFKGNL